MSSQNTPTQLFSLWAKEGLAERMERHHRPVVERIFSTLLPKRGDYLEIGCGTGYGVELMARGPHRRGHCIGIDSSEAMIALAKARTPVLPNMEYIAADFLTFTSERRFATLFSMETFYYFPEVHLALQRAHALLERGGELLVAVDYYRENPATHNWPQDLNLPMTLLSVGEYEMQFRGAGFMEVASRVIALPHHKKAREKGTLCVRGKKP